MSFADEGIVDPNPNEGEGKLYTEYLFNSHAILAALNLLSWIRALSYLRLF